MPITEIRPATALPVPLRGPPGLKGNVPSTDTDGVRFRFQNPDGSWSDWVNPVGPTGASGSARYFISRAQLAASTVDPVLIDRVYADGVAYVQGTSGGPYPVQDMGGTWWVLDIKHSELLSCDNGVLGNGGDDTATFAAWINRWKDTEEVDAILTHGTYRTTAKPPNFANPAGRFEGRGRPEIRYTGSDVIENFIDISDESQARPYQSLKNVVLRGTANVRKLLRIHNVNQTVIEDVQLFDCNPGYPAFQSESWVDGTLRNLIISGASGYGGFAPGAAPGGGVIFGRGTDSGHQTVGCLAENLKIEHIPNHFAIAYQNGSYIQLNGGTGESCGGGQLIGAGCNNNSTRDFFCEYNTGFGDDSVGTDIDNSGDNNSWENGEFVSPFNAVLHKGRGAIMKGSRVRDITIAASARGTILIDVKVIGTLTDNAPDTTMIGCYNETTGLYYPNKFPPAAGAGLPLNSGWSAESSQIVPCYFVSADGLLRFEGGFSANTTGLISTLPVGKRPANTRILRLINDSGAMVKITILPDGSMIQSGSVSNKYSLSGTFQIGA